MMRKYLPLLSIAVLIVAFILGHMFSQMDAAQVETYYKQLIPEAAQFQAINDRTARALGADNGLIAYVGVSSNIGYGGPLVVGTVISTEGALKDIVILQHKETPSYIDKITQDGFFRQFDKKEAGHALALDYDIDRVSGATLSTRAIALSVQQTAHTVAGKELNITPQKSDIIWQIGLEEILVALLFVASVLLSRYKRLAKYRFAFLCLSIAVLGFWLNRSLSMAHIGALLLGYFPSPGENLIWYIVLIGAVAPALLMGKNVYCTYVCPFCGLQEITHKISRINISLGKYIKWIRVLKEVLLFIVLFVAFLSLNPSLSSFEPFGTIFGLNGSSYQWYLLFILLIASFLFRRFWCIVFCPVGTFLNRVASFSRAVSAKIKGSSAMRAKAVEGNHEQ